MSDNEDKTEEVKEEITLEQLQEEVDQLREDVDYIIERKGLRELMDNDR